LIGGLIELTRWNYLKRAIVGVLKRENRLAIVRT
jgi:hypothetical protein